MELIISGRHLEIDDAVKAHTEGRMQRLQKEYPKLSTARVVVELERSWRVAEIHLTGKNVCLDAKAKSRDVVVSIDSALEKLERQLRRYVDRLQEHRPPKAPRAEESAADEDGVDVDDTVADRAMP